MGLELLEATLMYQIDLRSAKEQLDNLIQTALEGEEVIITENDKPILKLVRIPIEPFALFRKAPPTKPHRRSGSAKGLISMSDDFEEPLDDFDEYVQ